VGRDVAIGVVGATGAVGPVTLDLLRERGYENVRAFASARSAGKQLGGLSVEEATPEALSAGDLDLCLFSIGTAASRELVPHAVRGGAVAIDKSSAYRLQDGIPLVVPEVNGERALEHDGIVANPNCASIPLTCVLKPLHDAVGLARVRLATYQSASGGGHGANGTPPCPGSGRGRSRDGLGVRRRGVRRGVQAAGGDAQDSRAARAPGQCDLRPCSGHGRARRIGLDRDGRTDLAGSR
jgi:hypothetical protein